ncbi:DUF1295 domain-containing protein [Glaciihabitans arcticus]|uniref:DUF1295 domain-containing protein n=1 Tax=Glaciihabitans arcticus TaxID=2668039 RepID=A0A4Q9GSE3_9MICO|nr:DUF1295 domain-containing protein [Glaciihabitans arcticus]TBN56528.1 DUF1295 domain-containing protein [Glaciihabitans arcticus]
MDPVAVVLWIAFGVCAATWIASLITGEHSWVDRLWSIVPVVYVWVFAAASGFADTRLTVMGVLVTLWGARLTFNFARKGGYTGTEDYRWAVLRGRMKRWQFELFNLFFIVLYQNAILLLITLPALTVWLNPRPFGAWDVAVAVLFLALLAGETVADQQQWNSHAAKHTAGYAGPRFAQRGLWSVSRHPNFFFEQAQWWALFLFGAIAAGSLAQWTVLGAVLLTLLFVGSTIFTESITRSKYPEYAEYQLRVSPIVPWFPRHAGRKAATI